jgi:hypothetical protein
MRLVAGWAFSSIAVGLAFGCTGTSVEVLASSADQDAGGICLDATALDTGAFDDAKVGPGDADAATADGGRGMHGGTWPTYAHDFQRTARADGTGQMTHPTVAWTLPMGGILQSGQAAVGEVTGDGRAHAITLYGGRVICTAADGSTLWQSSLDGARAVLGIWNLNGGETPEVVVDTAQGVNILDGASGQRLATLPTTAASEADFVSLGATGGILLVATARDQLSGYDFRAGTSVTGATWSVPNDNSVAIAVGDIDGDGAPDVVHPRDDGFELLDPLTGTTKYSDRPLGPPAYFYDFQLVNVDATPGLELVAVDTSYIYSPAAGIYVMGVSNGALTTMWSHVATPSVALAADFYTVAGAVADLDGDGTLELVYSQWDGAAQTWTTYVVSAPSGTAVASIPGQFLQALADLDSDGKSEIVARTSPLADQTPIRSTLGAYDFDSAAIGPVPKSWTVPNAHLFDRAPSVFDHDLFVDLPAVATFDPPSAEMALLIGVDQSQHGTDTAIEVLRGDGSIAATHPVAAGVTPSILWWGNALTGASSVADVLAFGTDGTARVLDAQLHSGHAFPTGSYANWLGVLGLDPTHDIVAMATSEQQLLGIDGTRLHVDGSPYTVLRSSSVIDTSSLARTGWPLDPVAFLGGASPTLVHYEQDASNVTLVGTDSSGVELWRTPLAAGTTVYCPGRYASDFTGDGYPDLLIELMDVNALASIAIFDGVTGSLVRSTPLQTIAASADATYTGSLVDVNGDGSLDLVADIQTVGTVAIDVSSNPMSALWTVPVSVLPDYDGTIAAIAVDSTGTSLLRVNGNGGLGPYARYSLSGAVLASNGEGLTNLDNDTNSAALVRRTTGAAVFDMVAAGTSGAGQSRVERIAGDTLDTVWTVYAAGGVLLQAQPSPSFALHDPLTMDVDGDGAEEVVVGSDDGWLYAIHAVDGTLLFSVNLGAPVSHVVAADVDLDPANELVASLGDGRLVALDEPGRYAAARDTTSEAGVVPDAGTSDDDSGAASPACLVDTSPAPAATHVSCSVARAQDGGGCSEAALALIIALLARRRRSLLAVHGSQSQHDVP